MDEIVPTEAISSPQAARMDDATAAAAINSIFWEAGLSKAEVCKRITLENGEVVELNLERCNQMTSISPQIGVSKKLRNLNLSGCENLKTLPAVIGELVDLRELYLTNCHRLTELPPEIGKLVDLNELYLSNCTSLEELPPDIGQLQNLQELHLSGCKKIKHLPKELGNLVNLTEIKLCSCGQLEELLPEIGQLKNLTKLDLRLCSKLQKLPNEIGKLHRLTVLNLTGCSQLVVLPSEIGDLKKLTELVLKDCFQLVELPAEVAKLSQLVQLDLHGCTKLKMMARVLRQLHFSRETSHGAVNNNIRSPIDARQSCNVSTRGVTHFDKVPKKSLAKSASNSSFQQVTAKDLDSGLDKVPLPPTPDGVIASVGENDVLCGRGSGANSHPGNVRFRNIVKQYQLVYLRGRRRAVKNNIALKIISIVHRNGGKFLKQHEETGTWREICGEVAREKTLQALRQGAPELRHPWVHHEQQHAIRKRFEQKRNANMMMVEQPQHADHTPLLEKLSFFEHPWVKPLQRQEEFSTVTGKAESQAEGELDEPLRRKAAMAANPKASAVGKTVIDLTGFDMA